MSEDEAMAWERRAKEELAVAVNDRRAAEEREQTARYALAVAKRAVKTANAARKAVSP